MGVWWVRDLEVQVSWFRVSGLVGVGSRAV